MKPQLFRSEALHAQQDKLYGETLIARPPSLTMLTIAAALAAAAIVSFVIWGQYTRKEHVVGYLAPTKGLIKIFTPQIGTILEKRVVEGQAVKQGDVLLVVSSERATANAPEAQAAMLEALGARRESLQQELAKQAQIDALSARGLQERTRGLEAEIAQAGAQLEIQRSRIASYTRTVKRHQELLSAHFVSEATLQQKQEELLEQHSQLASIERNITGLKRDLDTARTELASSGLQRDNHAAAIQRQISELEQQVTEIDARRTVVLTAPADGTVTTILAEPGQSANPGSPLLSILPAGAQLEAHLLVPTRAAGFIRPQQEVALRYQAFPYQRFGHHVGRVGEIGRTVIQPNESNLPLSVTEPVYRVTVRLPVQQVLAYGHDMPLQAGMTLDADVRIDRRRLIEWVFDPILSVMRRV